MYGCLSPSRWILTEWSTHEAATQHLTYYQTLVVWRACLQRSLSLSLLPGTLTRLTISCRQSSSASNHRLVMKVNVREVKAIKNAHKVCRWAISLTAKNICYLGSVAVHATVLRLERKEHLKRQEINWSKSCASLNSSKSRDTWVKQLKGFSHQRSALNSKKKRATS